MVSETPFLIHEHVQEDQCPSRNCGKKLEVPSVSKSGKQHDLDSTGFRFFSNPEGKKRKRTLFGYLDELAFKV